MTQLVSPNARRGFTLMEVLVVIAIILILAAIAVPTYGFFLTNANKAVATQRMRDLGAATQNYIAANDGDLPQEDAKGSDTWATAAHPENNKAWYNALPKQMGKRSVADYVETPRDFYTKDNILFLPGATYPDSDKKLVKPLFAIAINTKLQRKDVDGRKPAVKLAQISNAATTVLFLEQGMPSEKKTTAVQSNNDYDGSPKGSAKSFIGRYGGKGIVVFVDGHAVEFDPKELLTETGQFPFPPTNAVWTRSPDEDPNKK